MPANITTSGRIGLLLQVLAGTPPEGRRKSILRVRWRAQHADARLAGYGTRCSLALERRWLVNPIFPARKTPARTGQLRWSARQGL